MAACTLTDLRPGGWSTSYCTYSSRGRHHVGSLVQNVRYYDSTLLCPFSGCEHHIDTLLQGARHCGNIGFSHRTRSEQFSLHVAAHQCLLTLAVLDTAQCSSSLDMAHEHASQCLRKTSFCLLGFSCTDLCRQKWCSRIVLRELTAGFSNCSRPRT